MKKVTIMLLTLICVVTLFGCQKHEHSYAKEITEEANCQKSGLITYTCECGDIYTEETQKTDEHTWNDGEITTEVSCLSDGLKKYICTVCEKEKEEIISSSGEHSWEELGITKEATCAEEGHGTKKCTVCGAEETWEIAKTEAHEWSAPIETKAASCFEDGILTYSCLICSAEKNETISQFGTHTWDEGTNTIEPTCIEKGEKTYTCKICQETTTEQIETVKEHKWDNGKTTKEATCSDDGEITFSCLICQTVKTESINKTGTHIWDDGKVTKEATCSNDGEIAYTCSECNSVRTESIEKIKEHIWNDGEITKDATCSEDGTKAFTCSVCLTTKTESIPKLTNHIWDEGQITKEATCIENGSITYTCTVCETKKRETVQKVEDHSYDAGTVLKKSTCISKGLKEYVCSACGITKNEIIEISQDHLWNGGKITKIPTDKADGEKLFSCIYCNATKTETILKLNDHSHSWDSGIDTVFATKISKGIRTYTCETCGEIKEESISAKGKESVWRQDVYYNFTVDKKVMNDGDFSICISSSEKNVISLDNEIRLKPKTSYIISMDIKTQNVVNHEGKEHDAFIFVTSGDNISFSSSVSGTTDWKTVYIPAKTDSLGRLTLSLALGYWNNACSGQAWFDNFKATELAEIEVQDPTWNCLFVIQTNVSFKTFNEDTGENINISHKMSDEEYKAICKSIEDFKNDLNEKADGVVKVKTTIVKSDAEFSDYDKLGYNSYYVSDKAALNYFNKNGINIDGYDHVFLINSFSELPRDYFGLGGTFINEFVAMSYFVYDDPTEYCYNINERNWPAGLYLHEFLHGVESYGNAIGYPVPSPDGSETYGYPDVDGWRTFYMDIVKNNVSYKGSYVGVNPLIWKLLPSMFN